MAVLMLSVRVAGKVPGVSD